MSKSAGRLCEVDIARFIGICIVIMQHSGMLYGGLLDFLTIFHMPLFFVLSAFFIRRDTSIKKLAKRLLLPYFLFYLLYLPFCFLWGRIFGIPPSSAAVFSDIQRMLCFYGVSVSWFLPALFFSEAVFIMQLRLLRGRAGKILFFVLLMLCLIPIRIFRTQIFTLWYGHLRADQLSAPLLYSISFHLLAAVCRLPMCVIFLGVGYAIRPSGGLLRGLKQGIKKKPGAGLCFVAAVFLYALCAFLAIQNQGGNVALFAYGRNILLYLAAVLCGVAATLLLSCALARLPGKAFSKLRSLVCFYGRNSLILLLSHLDFQLLYFSVLLSGIIPIVRSHGVLRLPAILILLLIMEIPVIFLVNKIKSV